MRDHSGGDVAFAFGMVWYGMVVKIKGNIVGGWMLFACLALSVVGNVVLMFGVGRKEGRN